MPQFFFNAVRPAILQLRLSQTPSSDETLHANHCKQRAHTCHSKLLMNSSGMGKRHATRVSFRKLDSAHNRGKQKSDETHRHCDVHPDHAGATVLRIRHPPTCRKYQAKPSRYKGGWMNTAGEEKLGDAENQQHSSRRNGFYCHHISHNLRSSGASLRVRRARRVCSCCQSILPQLPSVPALASHPNPLWDKTQSLFRRAQSPSSPANGPACRFRPG
jgi:hypothetical protein